MIRKKMSTNRFETIISSSSPRASTARHARSPTVTRSIAHTVPPYAFAYFISETQQTRHDQRRKTGQDGFEDCFTPPAAGMY
jgi:hypothetical protein